MTTHPATTPPAGPAWFSAVMGTGILATLLTLVGQGTVAHTASRALLVVAWALLVSVSSGFVIRVVRDRQVLAVSVRDTTVQPLWGTVSMGMLAVGAATLTVIPMIDPGWADSAVVADAALWSIGTLVGLVTTFGFTAVLIRSDAGHPTPIWGLPIVPPMVSATAGAALVPHVASTAGQFLLLLATFACFVLALGVAVVVFAIAYHHHWSVGPVPLAASASTWIPLGIVGQSTAAAQAMAAQTGPFLTPDAAAAAHAVANGYGLFMLVIAVPVVLYAVRVTATGFAAGMPFTPGWWALTFPIGTLSLGAHLLGETLDSAAVQAVASLALATLVGTWTLCAVSTVAALITPWPPAGSTRPSGSTGSTSSTSSTISAHQPLGQPQGPPDPLPGLRRGCGSADPVQAANHPG